MGWLDRFRGAPEKAAEKPVAEAAVAEEAPKAPEPTPRTPLKVGWLFRDDSGSMMLFEPEEIPVPERMRSVEMNKKHAKSASRCPAVINLESRYFVVRCPYDLHLRLERDDKGVAVLRNVQGEASAVRGKQLGKILSLTAEPEWRYPDRPTLQIHTPYVFIADEPVYLSQLPPFFHYVQPAWPGTLFGGRFPTHIWPRPLMWAFEWHDVKKDLILKRGDPWFYVHLETTQPDRPIQLVEAEPTPELVRYMNSLTGVVNFVNQSFALFKEAEKRRPEKLLVPKPRPNRQPS